MLVSSGWLVGCAGINPTPVADEDRDLTGKYDGQWYLVERPLNSLQSVAGQRFRCKFDSNRTILYVNDGEGRLGRGTNRGVGNIAKDGRFRIVIPTDLFFRSSVGSSEEGQRISYIFQGELSLERSSKGLFTIGKKALNNNGCSTRLTIESAKAAKSK